MEDCNVQSCGSGENFTAQTLFCKIQRISADIQNWVLLNVLVLVYVEMRMI